MTQNYVRVNVFELIHSLSRAGSQQENNNEQGLPLDLLNRADAIKRAAVVVRYLHLTPALFLVAKHESVSISELVMVFRMNGLGGDRACRKLIHHLHRLNLLEIESGKRDDRREKSIKASPETRTILAELRQHLASLGF